MNLFLADLYGNGARVVHQAEAQAKSVMQGWDETWNNVISADATKGLAYHQMCQLGMLFAICTLMFWMVVFTRSVLEDHYPMRPYADLLYPLFVAVLLFNNGALLSVFLHMIRAEINYIDDNILAAISAGIPIKEAIIESQQYAAISDHFSALIEQCQSMTGQEQVRCLQTVQQEAQR
jgi:cytochrome c oxidase subunit IV